MQAQLRILLMATFLSNLFGCCSGQKNKTDKEENLFPTEKFSVIQATMADGKPAIGSFNFAYKNYEQKAKYPWCLKIAIALNIDSLFESGLPKDSETKIANKLEDDLLTEVRKFAKAHYIGHLFNDTFLDVYIYLDDPEKVHKYLQTQTNKEGLVRGFGYEINNDPTWATVKEYMK